eukprot:Blabericola_migrator_1__4576@NODE_2430_length_2777_cov_89_767528_g1522_i0_p1_GENE_NODE_2430_length_2777_cov_89_767528_g1522_i0NODE_2430_length_2777_cov_89_767528_g1522_i0_p1_ORF_typecomplete_len548_score65_14DHHC/PF01529_20/9_5e03DHHC/PF01529_20/4_8e03DHHC/PF01529_20/2_4e28ABC2_membrane_3/PF12698_7/6_8_NODE_2430_length_2777_cov_89_767528_g1522_i0241667
MEVEGIDKTSKWTIWRLAPVVLVMSYRVWVYSTIVWVYPNSLIRPGAFDLVVWTTMIITVAFYLQTSLKDPGFQTSCPSKFLTGEQARRSDEVKVNLMRAHRKGASRSVYGRRAKHGQFVMSSSSEGESSADSSPPEGSSEDIDLEEGRHRSCSSNETRLDFGVPLDFAESSGGMYVVSCAVDSEATLSRKMRKPVIHTSEEDARTTAESWNHQSSTELELMRVKDDEAIEINFDRGSEPKDRKSVRGAIANSRTWRGRLWTLTFLFKIFIAYIKDWITVMLWPYKFLWKRAQIQEGVSTIEMQKLFSMGVHSLYQNGEKLRFCCHCSQWQVLRSKHCRSCGHCIKLHDHHCPWLGVCVGEQNRIYFLYFLSWQTIELLLTSVQIILAVFIKNGEWLEETNKHHDVSLLVVMPRVFLLLCAILLVSMALFTLCLFFYHLFLIGTNLTTWETMSWHRISYLKSKKQQHGSPFGSASCKSNFILAMLPSAYDRKLLLKMDSVEKWIDSRVLIGPGGSMLWKAKIPGDLEYGQLPPCTDNCCCNLYEACI